MYLIRNFGIIVLSFFTLNAISAPLESAKQPNNDPSKPENDTPKAASKPELIVPINKEKDPPTNTKQLTTYKQAINQLLYNSKLDNESLSRIKTLIISHSNTSNDVEALYYKALIYAKIAKNNFAFLDDSDTNALKAVEAFQKILHSSKISYQLRQMCEINIKQLYNLYINRGLKYYKMGHYDRAKNNYLIAKKIDKTSNEANIHLGCVYLSQGKNDKALKMYKQCTNLTHDNNVVAYYYGMAQLFNDMPQKTLKIVNSGLKIYPYNNDLIQKKLKILQALNKLNEYKNSINKEVFKGAKYYQMAKYYEFVGDKRELDFFKKAAKFSKNQYETEFALAILYYNKAAQYSKMVLDKFTKQVNETASDKKDATDTKKIKKKAKKQLSAETKLKRYLQLSKEKFIKTNIIKPSTLATEKINFINKYLNNLKQNKPNSLNKPTDLI